ncbi:MAG: hypothetical protein FJ315_01730, partial [SAR202 cluster bacterium]|nr:hypothetical protein [SAR202 cluster bacterium]
MTEQPDGAPHAVALEGPSHRYWDVVATPLREGQEAGGRVLVIRDVTEERTARQRSEREQRLAALGQLAAGVAHDFNNLLTAVIGAGEALRMRGDLPDPARVLVQRVLEGGRGASALVRQVLDFGRQSPTPTTSLNLATVAVNFQDMLRHAVRENIRMSLDLERGQLMVRGNAGQLEQVIMNLVVNAVDAMPEGGELRVQVGSVEFGQGTLPPTPDVPAGRWVALAVSDTGLGIAP